MVKKTGLGRGFDSLIPTGMSVGDVASPGETVKNLGIDSIFVNPDQPRKTFDEESISELSKSIKNHGIIQPLIVTPQKDKYRIVAGERRYRAAKKAGLQKVPVVVRNHEALEELEISLVENVQRVDLSPLEQAASIVKLRDQFSLSTKQIASKLGKAEPTISNIIRLLNLPPEAIEALQKGKISEGHARAILALKTDEKLQKELLNKIIVQKISVREAEAFVKSKRDGKPEPKAQSKYVQTAMKNVSSDMQKRIKIRESKNRSGTILVKYDNPENLTEILGKLNGKK